MPNMEISRHPYADLLRIEMMPNIWCSGCRIGRIKNVYIEAIQQLGYNPDKCAVVAGIGCSSRIAGYLNLDTIHSTHGRAIPTALGVKLANPELTVSAMGGDGDILGIGGNHFLAMGRHGHDINVFCMNNYGYSMTGFQHGPTTPLGARTVTTSGGSPYVPINPVAVALAAGYTFVARSTSSHPYHLMDCMISAMNNRGPSFVEILVPCMLFERRNKIKSLEALFLEKANIKETLSEQDVNQADFTKEISLGIFRDIPARETPQLRLVKSTKKKAAKKLRVDFKSRDSGIKHVQIRMEGTGGQGIVQGGKTLIHAAMNMDPKLNSTLTKRYGPEMKGGSCLTDVLLSSQPVDYPFVDVPDLLLMMSDIVAKERGGKVIVNNDGTIVVDESMVNLRLLANLPKTVKVFKIPATQIARENFRVVVANNVLLGFVCKVTSVIDKDCLKTAILKSAPPGTEEMNLAAFESGYRFGKR
ncbi:MAG: 2-oxoacid:acceptor oxidoreductase family protein [Desulfobacterales bacterium]|nr:2-oxoacid:acceptor oxidoreductase family protein [Desulfobacterales bacterium]